MITMRAQHERHKMRHECYTNDANVTRVKKFDFDNDTNETIFSQPYISYMANERLQGEEKFHSKNDLFGMLRSHAKKACESASQNLNFVIAKAIKTRRNTVSFSIKITLCETNNILFSKNY